MQNNKAYPVNQYAPMYLAGLNTPPPHEVGWEDKYFDYVFTPNGGEIAASVETEAELDIDQDADFYFTALLLSKGNARFLFRMVDATGFEMTDGFVDSTTVNWDSANPTQLTVHPLTRGSKVTITLKEITGSPVALQMVFKGYKRFRRATEESVA